MEEEDRCRHREKEPLEGVDGLDRFDDPDTLQPRIQGIAEGRESIDLEKAIQNPLADHMEKGQEDHSDPPGGDTDGIEPPSRLDPKDSQNDKDEKSVIFNHAPSRARGSVWIPLLAGEEAVKDVQGRSERTDPGAEEPSQHEGKSHDDQRGNKFCQQRSAPCQGEEGQKRIPPEEEVRRREGFERGKGQEEEEEKEEKKEELTDDPKPSHFRDAVD